MIVNEGAFTDYDFNVFVGTIYKFYYSQDDSDQGVIMETNLPTKDVSQFLFSISGVTILFTANSWLLRSWLQQNLSYYYFLTIRSKCGF